MVVNFDDEQIPEETLSLSLPSLPSPSLNLHSPSSTSLLPSFDSSITESESPGSPNMEDIYNTMVNKKAKIMGDNEFREGIKDKKLKDLEKKEDEKKEDGNSE
ncbi:unnamed protein product [Cunninghamella blakesleeana]